MLKSVREVSLKLQVFLRNTISNSVGEFILESMKSQYF